MRDNHRDTRIHGDNNVVGHGNIVTRNEVHNHNRIGSDGASKSGKTGEHENLPIGISIVGVVAISIWLFAKHSFEIFLYIKFAALISVVPFLVALGIILIGDKDRKKGVLNTLIGAALGFMVFFLVLKCHNHLDHRIVQLSLQLSWVDFWGALAEYEKQLVIQNFLAALILAISCLINILAGIFVAWSAATNADMHSSLVLYRLRAFRSGVSGFTLFVLLAIAWALMTGQAFDFIKSFQMTSL